MNTVISNDIKVKDYSVDLMRYCEENLVVDNPEFILAEKAGRYLGNIPKQINIYEKRGDVLVLPFGTINSIWGYIRDNSYELDFSAYNQLSMSGSINLYDYQERAVEALFSSKNGILQAPCGSGKTQTGIALIKKLGQKALWLTHTVDLMKQSMDRAKEYFTGDFGTITEGKVNIGKDITFATVQTMRKLDLQKYAYEWNVVIVDECHRVAGSPTKVMQFFKVLSNLKARHKYGLSATLERSDGLIKTTYSVLGEIVHTITDAEVGSKIIRSEHIAVSTELEDSEDFLETDGTMNYMKLIEYIIHSRKRNAIICNKIKREPFNYHLVLSHRVEHLNMLQANFEWLEIKSAVVHSAVTKKQRAIIYDAMKNGEIQVILATYPLAKEGLDIPILDRLHLVTPNKNKSAVIQSAGRIERNIVGKETPIIYDYVDYNISYCKHMYIRRKNILKKR